MSGSEALLRDLNTALNLLEDPELKEVRIILERCISMLETPLESTTKVVTESTAKAASEGPEYQILKALEGTTKDSPMPTVEIAKASGLGSTRKAVNKYLYSLQRAGKVVRVACNGGTKPHWYLV